MATNLQFDAQASALPVARRIILIWQNPVSRKFVKVGRLEEQADGRFVFQYLQGARAESSFVPLSQFPDVDEVYESNRLPAFFANRVMSTQRSSYADFLEWLGIDGDADLPVEILVRTGGSRATDTFHVVDDLQAAAGDVVVSRFLASGVRHVEGATERLAHLVSGAELQLRDEPDNPVNCNAVLIDVSDGAPLGYVPDWLLDDLTCLRSMTSDLRVVAERVNPKAPAHLQLLCRVEAQVGG